jgi:NAD(P)-dependent dehydrogenase (short-subunit alcohol dehydrogenase family)
VEDARPVHLHMDLELTGKRAIVTGGSRGIGKAVALQLAIEGADVGIAARDRERIDEASAELGSLTGRRIVGWSCDTRDDESVRTMVEGLAGALGGVDILVNAAAMPGGVVRPPKLGEITTEALWEEINTKVSGSILGSIRNVSVAALSKNLADELSPHGVTVTVVHPGATRTERTSDEAASRFSGNLIGRIVEAEEVAFVVAFLASPKSAAITGDAIAVGGGSSGAIHY